MEVEAKLILAATRIRTVLINNSPHNLHRPMQLLITMSNKMLVQRQFHSKVQTTETYSSSSKHQEVVGHNNK